MHRLNCVQLWEHDGLRQPAHHPCSRRSLSLAASLQHYGIPRGALPGGRTNSRPMASQIDTPLVSSSRLVKTPLQRPHAIFTPHAGPCEEDTPTAGPTTSPTAGPTEEPTAAPTAACICAEVCISKSPSMYGCWIISLSVGVASVGDEQQLKLQPPFVGLEILR